MKPDTRTQEVWFTGDADAPKSENQQGQSEKEDRGPALAARICPQIEVGGERQCKFTLLQTAIDGGMLTLPAALKMTGLGFGLFLLAFNGIVVFLGLDVMMRGAKRLQVKDTAALLAKCLGKWSGPLMDLLLAIYGNGTIITFFVRLGDFLPDVLSHMMALEWIPTFEPPVGSLRTTSLLASLCVILPMIFASKLSGLRFLHPVAAVSVLVTAITMLVKCPANFAAHAPNGFSDISWLRVDWKFFEAYGIMLLVSNCHLNAVPVVTEMQPASHSKIWSVSNDVAAICTVFYALIAAGGYLSFLSETHANVLGNYPGSPEILGCMCVMICCIWVGIPTFLHPSARSLRCFLRALWLPTRRNRSFSQVWSPPARRPMDSPLLAAVAQERGQTTVAWQRSENVIDDRKNEAVRIALTFICLVADLAVALHVTDLGLVMAIFGASAGTALMVFIPLAVLHELGREEFSRTYLIIASCALSLSAVLATMAVAVMPLQYMGVL